MVEGRYFSRTRSETREVTDIEDTIRRRTVGRPAVGTSVRDEGVSGRRVGREDEVRVTLPTWARDGRRM